MGEAISETAIHKCEAHPEKEGTWVCLKHRRYLCSSCADCRDPELYCKFRTRCLIWQRVKYGDL